MNKNLNNVVELTEKELEGVVGGGVLECPLRPGLAPELEAEKALEELRRRVTADENRAYCYGER